MVITPSSTGRDALLDQLGGHVYVRLTAGGDRVRGYRRNGTWAWTALGPWGPVAASLGEGEEALALFRELAGTGELGGTRWLHLPRMAPERVAAALPVALQDDWDFMWTGDSAGQELDEEVEALSEVDIPAILRVLDDALPGSTSRPGDSRIRQWYGIREGGELVAVAGDRSSTGVGFLAGIAVRSDRQGKGYGRRLTRHLTSRLIGEFGVCALGVMADNHQAMRLYERLGYTERIERSSIQLVSPGPA